MATLTIGRGATVVLDECDLMLISAYDWFAHRTRSGAYAAAWVRDPQKRSGRRIVLMHRVILGPLAGKETDHINGDGLDNRRVNLRACDHTQNQWNRKAQVGASRFKGVWFERDVKRSGPHRRWVARIQVNKKRITLGSFATEEEAGKAYDAAARLHFGAFARLNFPTENAG